jgi:hypothetical protein
MDAQQNPKWNVMIFLAGNNSLSEECVYGLTEVLNAKINGNIAVFAQLNTGVHRGTFLNLRDPEIKDRDGLHKKLNEALSAQHTRAAATQVGFERRSFRRRILDFVKQCIGTDKSKRAEHHMLILAGHGNGVLGEFLREDDRDNTGKDSTHINMINLGGLIEDIYNFLDRKKIDVLGMDSCLMSMTEIAYAVHNHVEVMVGAEGFEPMAGWPYHQVLEILSRYPDDLELLGQKIVDQYIEYYTVYQAANLSVDLAASDLNETVTVMKSIHSLADTLRPLLKLYPNDYKKMDIKQPPVSVVVRDAVLLAHWEAQLYKNEQYTDIYDFCTLLKARLSPKEEYKKVREACQNVLNAVAGVKKQIEREGKEEVALANPNFTARWSKDFPDEGDRWMKPVNFQEAKGFILKSCYSGWAVQYSYGVSVYFPWSEVPADMEEYHRLNFAKDSKWADFLDAYLAATKRDARRGKGEKPTQFATPILRENFSVAPTTFVGNRNGESNRNGETNRNGESNRSMTNMIGSMKNPATDFWECAEFDPPNRNTQ